MKKLAFILLTAVCTFPLFASLPTDTTIVIDNRKIEIIDDEHRLRVRVFDIIEHGEYVERQLAFEGHYRGGVVHERRHITVPTVPAIMIGNVPRAEPRRPTARFNPSWAGFGIGFNHFISDDISLNAMRSTEITWNIVDRAVPFSRNFGLVSGVGLTWNRFHLNDNRFFANVDGITMAIPPDEDITLKRSRLGINSITVPLLFEGQIRTQHNRRNFLYFSAGAIGSFNYMSRAKVRYQDGRITGENTTRGRDLNVRPLTVDLMAQVGVRPFALYVKYRPMGLFERDRGPEINPVSVGVMWHF